MCRTAHLAPETNAPRSRVDHTARWAQDDEVGLHHLVLLALVAAPSAGILQKPVPPADAQLVRVFVVTDDDGEPSELADRRQSVQDLLKALESKKKSIVVIDDEDAADVVLDVLGRGVDTPRVVIGLSARPGQPGSPMGPVRTAILQVGFAQGDERLVVTNKNKPNMTPGGWRGAAENIVDQVEKLIAERRVAILRRRGGVMPTAA
jgi:hypothetical protein